MSIFSLLKKNKGTVSSALGKKMAQDVLAGKMEILSEAIELTVYQVSNPKEKVIRSGAAKIVELVAEQRPELVAPHLEKLLPALEVKEAQTRWMVIRTLGYCASQNHHIAIKGIPYAKKYIQKKEGICLSAATSDYLGDIGALSKENAQQSFSLLTQACQNAVPNDIDWLLLAFAKIFPLLNDQSKAEVISYAQEFVHAPRKATQARAKAIIELGN